MGDLGTWAFLIMANYLANTKAQVILFGNPLKRLPLHYVIHLVSGFSVDLIYVCFSTWYIPKLGLSNNSSR